MTAEQRNMEALIRQHPNPYRWNGDALVVTSVVGIPNGSGGYDWIDEDEEVRTYRALRDLLGY